MLYDFPTDKQCNTLRFITAMLDVYFEGNTKSEARKFIMQHLDNAYREYNEQKEKNCEINRLANIRTNSGFKNKTKGSDNNINSNITKSNPWDNGWGEEEWWS